MCFNIPAYIEKLAKLRGTNYLAEATGSDKKQYSLDDGTFWNDFEVRVLADAAFKSNTIKLRQVLSGTLYDRGTCTVGRVSGISTA